MRERNYHKIYDEDHLNIFYLYDNMTLIFYLL